MAVLSLPMRFCAQPDLAQTYRAIADQGTDYFYRGPFAKSVAGWMKENGGLLTEADFANYHVAAS